MSRTMDKTLEPHLLKVREAMIGEAIALAGPILKIAKRWEDGINVGIDVVIHMSELRKLNVEVRQSPVISHTTTIYTPTQDDWLVGYDIGCQIPDDQTFMDDEGAGRNLLLGRGERFELAHYSCPPENVRVALDLVFAYRSLPDPTFGIVAGK